MMTNNWKNICLSVPILFLMVSFCQDTEKTWQKDSPLTWADFQANEKASKFNEKTVSNTRCRERFAYRLVDTSKINSYLIEFKVKSVMDRSGSWVDPAYKTPALLEHEQLHFDITEYFARQMLKEFQKGSYTRKFRSEIDDIKKRVIANRNTLQMLYDEQTNHSLNRKVQSKWNKYVKVLLENNPSLDSTMTHLPQ